MRSAPPDLRDVDLNLLRSLHALLDTVSVSLAATRLGITQAASSNALRRLRGHFGDALLVRAGARMRLTPLGERLRPLARAAMAMVATVLEAPAPFAPGSASARLRVATSDHIATVLLEPLLALLTREAPGVQLEIEPFSPAAVERVTGGAVDLLIAPREQMTDELRVIRILEEPYAVALAARHPAIRTAGALLSLDAFLAIDHIVVAPTGGPLAPGGTATDRLLQGLERQRQVSRVVTSFSHALLLVSESEGLTIVPRSFASRFAKRLGLAVLPVPLPLPPSRLDAGWSERLDDEPLHVWFRQQVVEVARGLAARAPGRGERA